MVGRITVHSLRKVFGNMGGVLRVSGVLTLVQFAVLYFSAASCSWISR